MTESTESSILAVELNQGDSPIRISAPSLESWTRELLLASGLSKDHAEAATRVFLSASLRCVGHHDISFLPQRLEWLTEKGVNPRPALILEKSFGALEVWDGDHGLGEVCCSHITDRAMELATNHGVGLATIRRSNHFLAASPYAQRGAESGYFLQVYSNTDPCMTGPGGTRNIIGNDPMGFGIPGSTSGEVVLDMCMAYSSLGNLRALEAQGKTVPQYWGSDSNGRPTDNPAKILGGGSVHPMGAHKGFGLALMVECLTGILSGGATGNQVVPGGGINTHNQTVIAVNLEVLGGSSLIAHRVTDLESRLKGDQPDLLFPGESSAHRRAQARVDGIPLETKTYESLLAWSKKLGVKPEALLK